MSEERVGQKVRRALCVVPDRDTFDLLQAQLLNVCYRADYAAGVNTGLEAAQCSDYDIYIIEHRWLADGHCVDFCREVRRRDTTTPILCYSRDVDPIDISQALAAGAQAFISLSDVLPHRVQQLVNAAEARDRLALEEETRCLREHIADRLQNAKEIQRAADRHFLESLYDALRAHALAEFVRAGGKRTLFERLYSQAFREAARHDGGPGSSFQEA